MNSLPNSRNELPGDNQEYDDMMLLEDLESLQEEIEEAGLNESSSPQALPMEFRERMADAGIRNLSDLRRRIEELHARLDSEDA